MRLRNQRLAGNSLDKPERVVSWLGAVQAQEYQWAKWALALRTKAATSAAIDRLLADGRIVRTHVMRPTWHLVHRADARWLLELTGPRVEAASAGYYRRLGLDTSTRKRSNAALERALQGRQLTRRELKDVLARRGIDVDPLRLGFLLMHAELSRVICSGGLRGKQFTYALFDERVPETDPLERDEAVARLATRYFTTHGPATPHDFAWWSGFTIADARRAIEAAGRALHRETFGETAYWYGAKVVAAGESPVAHLLPVYDEYLIAYRHRAAAFEPSVYETQREYIETDDVRWAHYLVVRGHVVGGWKRTTEKGTGVVTARLLRPLKVRERAAVDAAAERYAAFVEMPVRIEYAGPAPQRVDR
ncbi:MAG: winged helix DNA-binding domain-containing protein [Candidatus Limnocylindria bacterium]